jgi:protein arginine kinase activator
MSEKPIECGQCKKPVTIIYKKIAKNLKIYTETCQDCPCLQNKLGIVSNPFNETKKELCPKCGVELEMVKMGHPLGCEKCYETFAFFIIQELIVTDSIPPFIIEKYNTPPKTENHLQILHFGKSPKTFAQQTDSSQIDFLHEALTTALEKENYEQAALLRDQINSLKGNPL